MTAQKPAVSSVFSCRGSELPLVAQIFNLLCRRTGAFSPGKNAGGVPESQRDLRKCPKLQAQTRYARPKAGVCACCPERVDGLANVSRRPAMRRLRSTGQGAWPL